LCFETWVSHDQLAPGQRSYSQGRFLQDDVAHQLIVGHQPYLSELINVWCDTAQYHGLSTSGVAIIRLLMPSRGGGELLYYEPEGFLF
jgi:phosphohistidine phosphatase SixA